MSDDLLRKLGLRVRELRTSHGLTQAALAARVGCQASYFSHIENGVKAATVEILAAVACALGITLSELFVGVDRPLPDDFDHLAAALAGQSPARQRLLLELLERAIRLAEA